MKRRNLGAMVAFALAATLFAKVPTSADAAVYRLGPGARSNMYHDYGNNGGCNYSLWYGTFGNLHFAKIRFYSGRCNGTIISINISRTGDLNPVGQSQYTYTTGTDGCGVYYEQQITAPAGTHTIWGEDVLFFESSGNTRSVKSNSSSTQPVYRYC